MSSLEAQIALLARTYKPLRQSGLEASIAVHQHAVNTDPAILLAALADWCADGCTQPRQFWERVDAVSARLRSRYGIKENRDTDL